MDADVKLEDMCTMKEYAKLKPKMQKAVSALKQVLQTRYSHSKLDAGLPSPSYTTQCKFLVGTVSQDDDTELMDGLSDLCEDETSQVTTVF